MTFYSQVVFKVSAPVVAIGLIWCYPLSKVLRGQPSDEASNTVKRVALLMLELTLPSITTTLIQVFLCDRFDDGAFLRAMLTLRCDDSDTRARWVAFAVVGLVVYPLGGESRNNPEVITTSRARTTDS